MVAFNRLAAANQDDHRRVAVGALHREREDGRVNAFVVAGGLKLGFRVGEMVVSTNGQRHPTVSEIRAAVALACPAVEEALELWLQAVSASDRPWDPLSAILDKIAGERNHQSLYGGKAPLAEKAQVIRFDRTANDERLVGRAARHGAPHKHPPIQ